MTSITGFRYDTFEQDLQHRTLLDEKVAMSLSLMPSEDLKALSVVQVRVPLTHVNKGEPYKEVEGKATFWDTRMGCFNLGGFPPQTCRTCRYAKGDEKAKKGLADRCMGHFGYIAMPREDPSRDEDSDKYVVYNPALQQHLVKLLSIQCFFCHCFLVDSCVFNKWEAIFALFDAGCISGARKLEEMDKRTFDRIDFVGEMVKSLMIQDGIDPEPYMGLFIKNAELAKKWKAPPLKRDLSTVDIRNELIHNCTENLKPSSRWCSRCEGYSPILTKSLKKDTLGLLFYHFPTKELTHNISTGRITPEQKRELEADQRIFRRKRRFFPAHEAREHIKGLCKNETTFLSLLYSHLGEPTVQPEYVTHLKTKRLHHVFFLDGILVAPLPLRLQSGALVKNSKLYADEKTTLLNEVLRCTLEIEERYAHDPRDESEVEARELCFRKLQIKINEVYQTTISSFTKKEGLLRWNLMGKRVNQACRSVISPDFTVEPDEVLLPRTFARQMTFPEEVSCYSSVRVQFLKNCVVNGLSRYPGATHIEFHKNGVITVTELKGLNAEKREKKADDIFDSGLNSEYDKIIVYRHVISGDRVIFNRQPTLHKPSMQGYKARVLSGLKTLRFHYVNAKAYNADFDGDEMNIHVPQTVGCAAEVDTLMNSNLMYIAPTSGTPLRGLIQDHISSGLLLTLRDRFFSPTDFIQLLYVTLQPYLTGLLSTDFSKLVPTPAVTARTADGKVISLFTGKQIISVILRFVTGVNRGGAGINIPKTGAVKSLIQPKVYGFPLEQQKLLENDSLADHHLCVMDSTLVSGTLCKLQLGPSSNSIPHLVYEAYGAAATGMLFGALGRVLTTALQREGFSMGMNDMIVQSDAIDELRDCLNRVDVDFDPQYLKENDIVAGINDRASAIQKEFFPGKLKWRFPNNQLVLMTQSEAKGKSNNAVQMALTLGQQTFNNERAKPMNSNKSLPCFFTADPRARSYAFVMGSFARGIRPGEYTFHSMAGRDGLIDTGTKTSDSGFLQRCLIKGLESQKAEWDQTVRDADGSIIQFKYGGDGLDSMKVAVLADYETLYRNSRTFGLKYLSEHVLEEVAEEAAFMEGSNGKRLRVPTDALTGAAMPSPLTIAGHNAFASAVATESARKPLPAPFREGISRYVSHSVQGSNAKKDAAFSILCEIVNNKRLRSFVDAGEAVGFLAAHAAGEPSTQMTLNTFHSAGSTDSHVNTGIPRLRELLLYAKVKFVEVKVPVVACKDGPSAKVENEVIDEHQESSSYIGVRKREVERVRRLEKAIDKERIWEILDTAVPHKLEDYLIPLAPHNRFLYTMERHGNMSTLSIDMLFSHLALTHLRGQMKVADHVDALKQALKNFTNDFFRSVTKVDRFSRTKGEGENEDDDDDQCMMLHATDAEFTPEDIEEGMAQFNDLENEQNDNEDEGENADVSGEDEKENHEDDEEEDEEDDKSDRMKCASHSRKGAKKKAIGKKRIMMEEKSDNFAKGEKNNSTKASEDEDLEEEDEEQEEDNDIEDDNLNTEDDTMLNEIITEKNNKGLSAEENDDIEKEKENYSNINITLDYKKGMKMRIKYVPFSQAFPGETRSLGGAATVDKAMFVIHFIVDLPGDIVAVVPDVMNKCLSDARLFSKNLPQCEQAFWKYYNEKAPLEKGELIFRGEGATINNIRTMIALIAPQMVDPRSQYAIRLDQISSADFNDVATSFGIECAYKHLLAELYSVFKGYSVSIRHLSLITDTAMHRGFWEGYLIGIIKRNASPLYQMTVSRVKEYLENAVTKGIPDALETVSSSIIVGNKPKVGTRNVDLEVTAFPPIVGNIVEHF